MTTATHRRHPLALLLALGLAGGMALPAVTTTTAQAASQEPTQAEEASCEPGTLVTDPGWGPAALDLARAHELATGAGVTIAVVDSGVESDNPHLGDAVVPGIDVIGLDEVDLSGRQDEHGHGTGVATIAAGRPVDGSGLVGVAPGASVLPVRVYYGEGDSAVRAGVEATPQRLAQGIRAATAAGAQVIVVAQSTATDDVDLRAAVAEATAAGSLVVASMGNLREDVDPTVPLFPAAYPEVLAVGAMGYPFAPVGSHVGAHADVAGPGVGVLGGLPNGADCWFGAPGAGTSWATAVVAGAAALLAEAFPQEGPEGWTYRLSVTALRSDPDRHHRATGWGLIQPVAALTLVADGAERGVDSPVIERPKPPRQPVASPVVVTFEPDPWAPARASIAWWALGGSFAVALSLVAGRLAGRPVRGGRGPRRRG